jgi:hypothetical protein
LVALDVLEKHLPIGSRTLGFFAGWNEEMAAGARAGRTHGRSE